MKITFYLTIFCLLLNFQVFTQTVLSPKDFAGVYFVNDGLYSSQFTLKEDGTFDSSDWDDFSGASEGKGTYTLTSQLLHFSFSKYEPSRPRPKEVLELINPNEKKERDLILLKWSNRYYLSDESAIADFCNIVNLGLDPNIALKYEDTGFYAKMYSRDADKGKPLTGKPIIPDEWKSYLLEKPVVAKVIKLEKSGSGKIGIINQGSEQGLKTGMQLAGNRKDELEFRIFYKILSVEKNSSKIKVEGKLKIGEIISSTVKTFE